jgi:hypothetical protein
VQTSGAHTIHTKKNGVTRVYYHSSVQEDFLFERFDAALQARLFHGPGHSMRIQPLHASNPLSLLFDDNNSWYAQTGGATHCATIPPDILILSDTSLTPATRQRSKKVALQKWLSAHNT